MYVSTLMGVSKMNVTKPTANDPRFPMMLGR
jgi:hypothetical protein